MKSALFRLQPLGWVMVCCLINGTPAVAQVTADGTLSTSVTSPDGRNFTIEGGDRAGGNLFHSFRNFSVPTGGAAIFNNATDVQNIFSRVTGSQTSNIDGLIHANGATNVFLLNPNGIIFGPNAVLDVGGAFVATTGDRIQFSDGSFFNATDSPTTPLLTISTPIGLQFGRQPGAIALQRAPESIFFHPAQSFVLAGNHLQLNSGQLIVPGGHIDLASIGGAGTIGLKLSDQQVQLTVPSTVPRSDLVLSQGAIVSVNAPDGGDISIHAQNLTLLDNSVLAAGVTAGGSLSSHAGTITIDASDSVRLDASTMVNDVAAGAVGHGGDINLKARSLFVESGSMLGTLVYGQGNGGNLNLDIDQRINVRGFGSTGAPSTLLSALMTGGTGTAGDINITTGSLNVRHGAQLFSGSLGNGNAGDLNIQARDRILVAGSASRPGFEGPLANSFMISGVVPGGVGVGGTIHIQAGSLVLRDGGLISATISGQGQGGDVNIQVKNDTIVDGVGRNGVSSLISTGIDPQGTGDSGDLHLSTGRLSVTNGAFLSASTQGRGNSGNIQIRATDGVFVSGISRDGVGGFISVTVEAGAVGRGGDLTIDTNRLDMSRGAAITTRTRTDGDSGDLILNAQAIHLEGGSQIVSSSSGDGRSGDILIRANDGIILSGQDANYAHRMATADGGVLNLSVDNVSAYSGVYTNTTRGSNGEGGSLDLNTNQLTLQDRAELNVSSQGTGRAGDINVNANSILLRQASLQAQSRGGDRGSITVDTTRLLLRDNSQISTNAVGTASGGNITLNGDFIIGLNNSDIVARAQQGQGGNIYLAAQSVLGIAPHATLTSDSDINASSQIGLSGSVSISNPAIKPDAGLVELPTNVVDASRQIAQVCESTQANQFIVTGRGGLPDDPTQVLRGDRPWYDLRTLSSMTEPVTAAAMPTDPSNWVEASSWRLNVQGQVELVTIASMTPSHPPETCGTAAR